MNGGRKPPIHWTAKRSETKRVSAVVPECGEEVMRNRNLSRWTMWGCLLQLALTTALSLPPRLHPTTAARSIHPIRATASSSVASPEGREYLLGVFASETVSALSNGSFVKLTLGGNAVEQSAEEESPLARLKRIEGRFVQIGKKKEGRLQLTLKYQHRDTCINVPMRSVSQALSRWLAPGSFRRGRLLSTAGDLSLERHESFDLSLRRLRPTCVSAPTPTHDRVKGMPIAKDAGFLQALGVVNTDGSPRKGMRPKLRQIEKFVETLAALVKRGCSTAHPDDAGGGATQRPPLRIVDAGCGRGYLTFAAHSYFEQQGWAVQTTGSSFLVLFLIRPHTPFPPYVSPRFPHMSQINSPFARRRGEIGSRQIDEWSRRTGSFNSPTHPLFPHMSHPVSPICPKLILLSHSSAPTLARSALSAHQSRTTSRGSKEEGGLKVKGGSKVLGMAGGRSKVEGMGGGGVKMDEGLTCSWRSMRATPPPTTLSGAASPTTLG